MYVSSRTRYLYGILISAVINVLFASTDTAIFTITLTNQNQGPRSCHKVIKYTCICV